MENKKEIKKAFDDLTEDVLDHYSDYKIEHKIMVKTQLDNFRKLNEALSVYDDKRQKEEIKKEFNRLRDELLDHYDDYDDIHKDMVKAELTKQENLNKILDKYDKSNEVEKKKTLWELICQAFGI